MHLSDLAIKYALENNWQEACNINLLILEEASSDIDALNRLAFSYLKLSLYELAEKTYNRVISLDKTNPIANKNLKKLNNISKQTSTNEKVNHAISSISYDDLYIEEVGKTKTIELKNIADKKTLSLLQPGEHVYISPKRSKVFVQTQDRQYIGVLPDNLGMRLVSLIKGGNEYQACIKSISEKNVAVFIKEVKRAPKFKNQPSFVSSFATK